MSKFNKQLGIKETLERAPGATKNYEGGLAYIPGAKEKLLKMVATSLVGENKFYTDGKKSDSELLSAIHSVIKDDPEFVLKLAAYARKVLNMRSVSMVLLGEFANSEAVGTVRNSRKYVAKTIARPDEITELLAYQFNRNAVSPRDATNPNKAKIPMMIKNGIAMAFNNFDSYQFGKWGGRR